MSRPPRRPEPGRRKTGSEGGIRIQKLLSRAGVASRRQAEELMVQGRVRVNGKFVTELGSRVDPSRDVVELDGRRVEVEAPRWVLLHKPVGTLTTLRDPGRGRTVYHLLPPDMRGLRYLGRLDRNTEGLLLLTNEGDVGHRLLHPSSEVEREYVAGVEGVPDAGALRALTKGVELEDGFARATSARPLPREAEGGVVALVLLEGRKREVRRLLEAVGHPVRWLRRVRFGPQELGDLPPGRWRELRPEEVERLRERARRGASRRPGRHGRRSGGGREKP